MVCSTCDGSERVALMPGQYPYDDEDDGQQPCPDCVATRPRNRGVVR